MKPRGMMIINQFRPITNGAELQAERLAAKMVEMGHGMQVLTEYIVPGSLPEEVIGGVKVHRVPFRLAHRVLWRGVTSTFRYLVMNRRQYDVLHVHQALARAVVATVVARSFGKRCIIKVACAGDYGDLTVFSRQLGSGWGLRVMRQADAIIAISSDVERELIDQWGFPAERVVRIPNGVDTEFFRRTRDFPSRDKVRFALIGRRHPQKGVDIVLDAARVLKARGLSNRFEIKFYGTDYPEYDYRLMADVFGVGDLVEFLPHRDDTLNIYQAIHCILLPSRGEGLSNVLLEAMAMELPVIVTPVSGTVDVVEDGKDGIVVPLESPDALASAMMAIIDNPELALRLGKSARVKVQDQFSLEGVARRYSDLYQQLCTV